MSRYLFPKELRIAKKAEIKNLFNQGVKFKVDGFFFCIYITNEKQSRFLVSVSKRVGSAPQRNYIKRIMREAFRLQQEQFTCSFDMAVFFKKKPYHTITLHCAKEAVKKAGLHLTKDLSL